jgi:hypothetical protein
MAEGDDKPEMRHRLSDTDEALKIVLVKTLAYHEAYHDRGDACDLMEALGWV